VTGNEFKNEQNEIKTLNILMRKKKTKNALLGQPQ
jgi:hypothetical protein